MVAQLARSQRAFTKTDMDTTFPTRQLFILALCRICEPIAFMSIFPYIYYMVSSFDITKDERQIAIYASLVTSAFAIAEFSTGFLWGRLSDKIGRKPILLTGMAGTGLSMLLFGLAPSFPVALFARALGGLLNGNIGVLQTTVAEVVKVDAHRPRAYSIMPFVWCLGSIIGAGLGGTLAEPVKNYPGTFLPGSIWDKYPYLLPNLVCTAVVVFGLCVGVLFLEETHEEKRSRTDYGVQAGQALLRLFRRRSVNETKTGFFDETLSFLAEDGNPRYQSLDSTPRSSCSEAGVEAEESFASPERCEKSGLLKVSLRQAFTPQVVVNIVAYGILAFHTISLEQLLAVLFSMPKQDGPVHLPFQFTGGFAFPTKTTGYILSSQGFFQMIAQIFVFPMVSRRFGSLRTFRTVALAYPLMYLMIPYLPLLPSASLQWAGVFLILIWKVTAQSLSYPSLAMMLADLAPSTRVLGSLNGGAAASASFARAIGPAVSGIVHTAGLRIGSSGLSWWACALVALLGAAESWFMRDPNHHHHHHHHQPVMQFDDEEAMLIHPDTSHASSSSSSSSSLPPLQPPSSPLGLDGALPARPMTPPGAGADLLVEPFAEKC